MSSSQPGSGSNDRLSPFLEMLVNLGSLPEWVNVLSAIFLCVATTGFIIIPASFLTLSEDGTTYSLSLNTKLFITGYMIITIGVFGMGWLSYYPYASFTPLRGNHFWLFHRFYLRMAEGGLYGLVSVLVAFFGIRQRHMDATIIAAIVVACYIKIVSGGYAIRSYLILRIARKTYWRETLQHQAEKPQAPEDSYVQMLLGFATLPGWFSNLFGILTMLITMGFITIPLALVSLEEDNNPINGEIKLIKKLSESEPLFAISISVSFVCLIAAFVLSRYQYRDQMPLKENHFWLYHRYYRPVTEAGIYGLIELFLSIKVLGNEMTPPTIAAFCITCIVTALFGLLASWSYFKTRQARKAYETRLNAPG